jgi:hypothetical protein
MDARSSRAAYRDHPGAADGNGDFRRPIYLSQQGRRALCCIYISTRDANALDGNITLEMGVEGMLDGSVSTRTCFADHPVSIQYELLLKHPNCAFQVHIECI